MIVCDTTQDDPLSLNQLRCGWDIECQKIDVEFFGSFFFLVLCKKCEWKIWNSDVHPMISMFVEMFQRVGGTNFLIDIFQNIKLVEQQNTPKNPAK